MATAIRGYCLGLYKHCRYLDDLARNRLHHPVRLFTSPQSVEIDVVTAISQADTTKSASVSITVAAPHTVSLTWSPSSSTHVRVASKALTPIRHKLPLQYLNDKVEAVKVQSFSRDWCSCLRRKSALPSQLVNSCNNVEVSAAALNQVIFIRWARNLGR